MSQQRTEATAETTSAREVWRVVRDACIVVVLSTVAALGANAVRANGIPLVQKQAYDILVPCPEPVGDPGEIGPQDPGLKAKTSLLFDVRSQEEFAAWHLDGARSRPFDWLGPPVDAEVQAVARQVAASKAQRVIVYGDGDDPDSGREWAKLLSGARIKNVFYVRGGAPALNPALDKPPGRGAPAVDDAAAPPPPPSSAAPAGSEEQP